MFNPKVTLSLPVRALFWLLALASTGLLLTWAISQAPAKNKLCPDYICYWAAGSIIASGGNPYDVSLQTSLQVAAGWDQKTDGLGKYPFLPFYYPPWFAMICAVVVPLGFPLAKAAWLVFNLQLLVLTAYLLRDSVPGVPRAIPMVAVPLFIFSWVSVVIGQTTPLIFFLLAGSWKLAEVRRDRLAGLALAWLSIKPQLTGVLLIGVLIWAVRQRRWGLLQGFFGMLAGLAAVSFVILPTWPFEMLNAPRVTLPPTEHYPWIGTTWFLFLKGLGLTGPSLWVPYLIVALPFLGVLVRSSLDRSRSFAEVLSVGLLAAYVVAPYGRHYDFPVLLIPVLVMIGGRLSERSGALLLMTLLVVPYLQYLAFPWIKAQMQIEGAFNPEVTFTWLPLLVTVAWFASDRRGRADRTDA